MFFLTSSVLVPIALVNKYIPAVTAARTVTNKKIGFRFNTALNIPWATVAAWVATVAAFSATNRAATLACKAPSAMAHAPIAIAMAP